MSVVHQDPRVDEAKGIPVAEVLDRLGVVGLRTTGCERVGPCPLCGGRDRFGVNLRTTLFQCRKCGIKGGDQIALVQQIQGLGFKDALQWLCGDAPASIDPQEIARRRAKAEAAARAQAADADRYRERAIRAARKIWDKGRPGAQGVVRAYLLARGFSPAMLPELPRDLRFIVEHPYSKLIGGKLVTVQTGPCMIAAVRAPDGSVMAVHQTWVDSDPPHGKAKIVYQGETLPSKLVRGSKKGGAIRLHTPERFDTLVMGEGIETTLSALVARPYPNAAYWAGVDLGNMSGRMQRVDGKKHSGLPDMSDDRAFYPPSWVKRLVFIKDGDSSPAMTHAKLQSGLRRAMALVPGLVGEIVEAGAGVDMNDVLNSNGGGNDE